MGLATQKVSLKQTSRARGKQAQKPRYGSGKTSQIPFYLQAKLKKNPEEDDNSLTNEDHKLTSVAQLKLKIGRPNDKYEREADKVADRVISGQASIQTGPVDISALNTSQAGIQSQSDSRTPARNDSDSIEQQIRNPQASSAIPESVRQQIEPVLGYSLSHVRVVESAQGRQTTDTLNARAFTHGNVIWLGKGQSKFDTALMAHEATHVIQQGNYPSRPQAPLEPQAEQNTQNVNPVPPTPAISSTPSTDTPVQRSIASTFGDAWDATGGRVVRAAEHTARTAVNAVKDLAWSVLETVAPDFVPILRDIIKEGFFSYLYSRLKKLAVRLFKFAGIKPDKINAIFGLFEAMGARLVEIVTALMQGDCKPLFSALRQLKNLLSEIAGQVWDRFSNVFSPVFTMFTDLWNNISTPVADLLGRISDSVSGTLKTIYDKFSSWVAKIKAKSSRAWDWVKDKLGLGGSGDSGGGSSSEGQSWIGQKLSAIWSTIKKELNPIIEPVRKVIGKIREFLPLDAIVSLKDKVVNWMTQITSLSENMEGSDGVVQNQNILRNSIIPAVIAHITSLQEKLLLAGLWVKQKISALVAGIQGFIGNIGKITFLSFARPVLSLLEKVLLKVQTWATKTVYSIFLKLYFILGKVKQFIVPVFNVLNKLAGVIGNLAGKLVDLVTSAVWVIIPKCIVEPIKKFIINQILSRIPIFNQLFSLPDIWEKVKNTALNILKQIFVDGNLARAAWTFFSAILRIFNIPPELVSGILKNAATAIGDILSNPIGFLINLLRSVKTGFSQFFGKIFTHLLNGVTRWLLGGLSSIGITPPENFTPAAMFNLVLQILDITRERIFERLSRQLNPATVEKLRNALDMATGAWEWFARLVNEGPGALWDALKEKVSNIWDSVTSALVSWLSINVISKVTRKLLSMLDPSGVMAVVNSLIAIYKAIESFMAYLRQMLEIVSRVFAGIASIAKGAISQAANYLENALASAIPVVIGFLANQAGIGDLASKIKEMVEKVRTKVNQALDWLISKTLRMGRGVLNLLKTGAKKVKTGLKKLKNWWQGEARFSTRSGAQHRIYIQGNNASARLMLASEPQTYQAFISNLDMASDKKAAARTIAEELDQLISSASGDEQANEQLNNTINNKIAQLAELTAPLMDEDPNKPLQGDNLPEMDRKRSVRHATRSLGGETVGISMHGHFLGPGYQDRGSPTRGNQPRLMARLATNPGKRNNGKYIRGHLLNHNLGGKGEDNNLFPITAEANKNHNIQVEEPIKTMINTQKFWMFYSVNVRISEIVLNNEDKNKNYINAQFVCKANKITMQGQLLTDGKIERSIPSVYTEDTRDISEVNSARETFYISNQSVNELVKLDGITPEQAQRIANRKFFTWAQLLSTMGVPENEKDAAALKIQNTENYNVRLYSN